MMKSKRTHLLLQLAAGLLLLVALTRTWVVFTLESGAAAISQVQVSGQTGIAALLPVTIALLAIAITFGLTGRVFRVLLGALTVIMGAWVAVTSGRIAFGGADSVLRFGSQPLQEAMGLAAHDHSAFVTDMAVSVWPTVTAILGAVVALIGVLSTVLGWAWVRGGQKYETSSRSREVVSGDRIAEWDALSSGADPSDDSTRASGSPNSNETR